MLGDYKFFTRKLKHWGGKEIVVLGLRVRLITAFDAVFKVNYQVLQQTKIENPSKSRENRVMKVVTYWESAPGLKVPTYIPLCIASMKIAFGDSFLLLTNRNIEHYLGLLDLKKVWKFEGFDNQLISPVASIVAKSDWLRMAYIHLYGGFWLDADTLALENFLTSLEISKADSRLFWHSEQFFGANKGNFLLGSAQDNLLQDKPQTWGNPGGIKDLIFSNPAMISPIPINFVDPGYNPAYCAGNWDVMFDKTVSSETFLINPEIKIIKFYNSNWRQFDNSYEPIEEFLRSGSLMSKLFLRLNPSNEFWQEQAQRVLDAF